MRPGINNAIISIRPEFADAILDGSKTVELRRRVPRIELGTKLWIYATLPTGAIVGTVVVAQIAKGTPTRIWRDWREHAGVSRDVFREYFSGAPEAVALKLVQPRLVNHVPMVSLSRIRKGFRPPQVMAQLTTKEARCLHSLARK